MATSDSDFEIFSTTNINELTKALAIKLYADHSRKKNSAVSAWETHILINGYEEYGNSSVELTYEESELDSNLREEIRTMANSEFNKMILADKEKAEAEAKRAADALAAANERTRIETEQRELAELRRLQNKYGHL